MVRSFALFSKSPKLTLHRETPFVRVTDPPSIYDTPQLSEVKEIWVANGRFS